MIERVVFTHFLREQDETIQLLSQTAMENLFSGWIGKRSIDHAYRNLLKIDAAVGSLSKEMPWKRDSFNGLLDSLTGSARIEPLIAMIRETDTESLAPETGPLVHFFGSPNGRSVTGGTGTGRGAVPSGTTGENVAVAGNARHRRAASCTAIASLVSGAKCGHGSWGDRRTGSGF